MIRHGAALLGGVANFLAPSANPMPLARAERAMIQTTANATAGMGGTTPASDADAFWRGVVAHYGSW